MVGKTRKKSENTLCGNWKEISSCFLNRIVWPPASFTSGYSSWFSVPLIFHRCVAIQLIKELKFADDVCSCSNIDLNTPKEIWRNFMFDVQ